MHATLVHHVYVQAQDAARNYRSEVNKLTSDAVLTLWTGDGKVFGHSEQPLTQYDHDVGHAMLEGEQQSSCAEAWCTLRTQADIWVYTQCTTALQHAVLTQLLQAM